MLESFHFLVCHSIFSYAHILLLVDEVFLLVSQFPKDKYPSKNVKHILFLLLSFDHYRVQQVSKTYAYRKKLSKYIEEKSNL